MHIFFLERIKEMFYFEIEKFENKNFKRCFSLVLYIIWRLKRILYVFITLIIVLLKEKKACHFYMFMLFVFVEGEVEMKSLAFSVCTAAGQNSSCWDIKWREKEQDLLLVLSLLALRSWEPATATFSGILSSPLVLHSYLCLSVWKAPVQQTRVASVTAGEMSACDGLIQKAVEIHSHVLFVCFLLWLLDILDFVFLCKDMKSLFTPPADEPGSWCFIPPLDLPLGFYTTWHSIGLQTIWRFAFIRLRLTRSSPY